MLREINGNRFELIYYNRPDTEVSKVSHYHIIPLARDESESVIKVLSETNAVKVVVQKWRELLLYKHTRIHLDKVADWEEFVELETVVENIAMSDAEIEHKKVIRLLGLDQFEKCKTSYSDLLLK